MSQALEILSYGTPLHAMMLNIYHSPEIPERQNMKHIFDRALEFTPREQLWINPDCGLKTRGWEEIEPSLRIMMQLCFSLRQKIH